MIIQYDRLKAVEYARKWALGRNEKFGNFSGIGGDCTNFISQCLLAGGGAMNFDYVKGWYFESMTKRSPSWTSVAYLQRFLLRNDEDIGPFARISTLEEVEIGDIIQLRQNPTHFNHSVIVTKKFDGQIFVCAHSNDALDKHIDRFYAKAIMPLHIIGTRI